VEQMQVCRFVDHFLFFKDLIDTAFEHAEVDDRTQRAHEPSHLFCRSRSIGAGPIGLLTALFASFRGVPKVLITDVFPSRLELAARLGLQAALAGEEFQTLVSRETDEEGADSRV
jgi:threonine dehydrogenase-like Zn-dependent dehydrogenase